MLLRPTTCRLPIFAAVVALAGCGDPGRGTDAGTLGSWKLPLPDERPVAVASAPVATPFLTAVERSPQVRAAAARLRAARAAAGAATVLPDPRVFGEYSSRPRSGDGLELWVEQELPRWGERDAAAAAARASILVAGAELDEARATIAADLASDLIAADAAGKRAELRRAQAERARALADGLTAGVAAGRVRSAEVLAVRSRIDGAEQAAAEAARDHDDARRQAVARLGLQPGAELPSLPSLPSPLSSVDDAPAVRLAAARRLVAAADESMAAGRARPQVTVGVGWQRDDLGDDRDEAWMLGLALAVPVDRTAVDGRRAAAAAMREASGHLLTAARLSAVAARERAERAAVVATAAAARAGTSAQRLEAELAVLRSEVAAGGGSILLLVDRLDALVEAQLAANDAQAAQAAAGAELWRLGVPSPTPPVPGVP